MRKARPDYNDPETGRFARFGLTAESYMVLLKAQDFKCAICRTPTPGRHTAMSSWSVDHDHSCCAGKYSCGLCVRGLLCSTCNAGLGMFKDSMANLESAYQYLECWAERPDHGAAR